MKRLGVQAKLLMGDGGCTTEFPKLAGDAAAGHYCSLPGIPLEQMSGGPAFRERYKQKFKADIQLYAPYSYDAVMVMIDAMKRADSVEPTKYLAELPKTDYAGLTSRINFDANGDIKNGAVTIYRFSDGSKEPLETIGATVAPASPTVKTNEQ
jgi:branched-chain amino acid transport system substrate-binding protein